MSSCAKCRSSRSKGALIRCEGACGDVYHCSCVGIGDEECKLLSGRKGFLYLCETCRVRCEVDLRDRWTSIIEKFDSKLEQLQTTFMTELQSIKNENRELQDRIAKLNALLDGKQGHSVGPSRGPSTSYAEKVASAAPVGKIIVKPKDLAQSSTMTKSEIIKNVDTLGSGAIVTAAREVRNGGIVLDCQNSEVFKKMAVEKLSERYDVNEIKKLNPRIRVVGMSSDVDKSLVIPYLVKANPLIFENESGCHIVKYGPTRKNADVFQATIQLDVASYKRAVAAKHVLVGLDRCGVFGAIDVIRCFRCNGYNHISTSCTQDQSCPRCAGPHRLEECKSEALRCSNCVRVGSAKAPHVDHAVWEVDKCDAYRLRQGRLEHEILG